MSRSVINMKTQQSSAPKGDRIELGLVLLARHVPPGARVPQETIAAWCGCTKQNVYEMELRAKRKFRTRARALLKELQA